MKRASPVPSLAAHVASEFLPVPLLTLFPGEAGDFEVYIRQGESFVLYARGGEHILATRRERLLEHGWDTVYIRAEERGSYRTYVRRRLPEALLGHELSETEKMAVLYRDTREIIRDLLREKLPLGVSDKHQTLFFDFVRRGVSLLGGSAGLERMGRLMVHDYDVYLHGVHVFVYVVFLLKSLGLDDDRVARIGVGALLHDAGKETVDVSILQKPGPLTEAEWRIIRGHPLAGARLCRGLSLPPEALDCILMHHEKLDGRGYPRGLGGQDIPTHVRAVSLADAYDALTSKRVYAEAVRPFEALRIMRDEMAGSFDPDLYRRFVLLLSGANLL